MGVKTHLVPRSTNVKTGDVPTVWIGTTRAEAQASCDAAKCPLRPWALTGPVACYAHTGTTLLALSSIRRSLDARGGTVPGFRTQLRHRSRTARIVRVAPIGDPAVMPWGWWYRLERLARAEGLDVVSYTHGWRDRPDLAGRTMASCETFAEADEARRLGFQPAVVADVPPIPGAQAEADGTRTVVCPHQVAKAQGRPAITCNDCRLCTGKRKDLTVVFIPH